MIKESPKKHPPDQKHESGMALPMVILFLLVASLAVPVVLMLTQQESKYSVRAKHQTVAYQVASGGVERTIWKLKESTDFWDLIIASGSLTGYNNDQTYQDINLDNGLYRVKISSVTADEFHILVNGKDTRANEYRAVQASIRRTQVVAPLHGYEIGKSTTVPFKITTHWGSIIDTSQLMLSSAELNQYYPLKYSASLIDKSAGVYSARDLSPDNPNTDDEEYYAYNNVYPLPTPDMDYYRGEADLQGNYFSSNKTYKNVSDATPQIRFIDGNCTIQGKNSFLKGLLFVVGDLTIKGNRNPGVGVYSVLPPSDAYAHYQKNAPSRKNNTVSGTYPYNIGEYGPDSLDQDEYPGDGGLNTVKNFTFSGSGSCASCEATGRTPAFQGLIYVTGNLSGGSGNPQVIHGALVLAKGATTSTGWFEVFYDETISIKTTTQGIYTSSWEETNPTPF